MPEIAINPRLRKSPFFDATVKAGVTEFTVYNHMLMPTSYGDPAGEYWRLINGVSLWDVAAERQVEFSGPDAARLAQYLTPRNLSTCRIGRGKYVPMCNHQGHLLNDPVLLRIDEDRYWLSLADSDVRLWVQAVIAEGGFVVEAHEPDVSPLALQGPGAEAVIIDLFGEWVKELKYFWFREANLNGIPLVVARSGWSKQGGFELYLRDGSRGTELWDIVWEAGRPSDIGPGTPNGIERVESALLSYGTDTEPDTNPFEVGLRRYVDLEQEAEFIGKAALEAIAAEGPRHHQLGLFIEEGAPIVPNQHKWPVQVDGYTVGNVTAAVYSPRLERNIALALVESRVSTGGEAVTVLTPDGSRQAETTTLPFC